MAPLILLVPMREINDVISQLLTMLGCGSLGILLYRLYQQVPSLFGFRLLDSLIWLFLIATPLGLIILILTGYYYTTLVILGHLVISLFVIGVWALLRAVIKRGIYVASRRLAFSRALSRREAMREDREVEIPNLDLETINRQTIRLLNAFMIALLVLLLYWVWQDMITIFLPYRCHHDYHHRDEKRHLATGRHYDSPAADTGDHGAVAKPAWGYSKLRYCHACSYLKAQGMRSAHCSVIRSQPLGVLSVLSTLGVSWDKLQWLVAAVGVGLGFWLAGNLCQFYFRHYHPVLNDRFVLATRSPSAHSVVPCHVSGYERLLITDWDNKEIVIPNKVFITDQLINWTLSDPENSRRLSWLVSPMAPILPRPASCYCRLPMKIHGY